MAEPAPAEKKDAKAPHIAVKNQTVAGFIIYRRTEEGTKFLLLYRRGNYWNFPKGHFEDGENSMRAALREAEEETGIKESELKIIPNFRTFLHYNFRVGNERIYDKVVLYLAETKKAEVTIVPREHSGYGWFIYQDALKTIGGKYIGTKKVLKQAHDFLRRKNEEGHGGAGAPARRPNGRRSRRRGHGRRGPVVDRASKKTTA